jgi:hypothetical protein
MEHFVVVVSATRRESPGNLASAIRERMEILRDVTKLAAKTLRKR